MKKPYVISAELDLMGTETGNVIQTRDLEVFRESLDTDLRNYGKQPVWIPAGILRQGMEDLSSGTRMPVVSLDDRYIRTADVYLGISRGIDTDLNDAGYTARSGYPEIGLQFDAIASLGTDVALVDDVLFSGEMALSITEALAGRDIRVRSFLCGIAIGEGIDKLTAEGIDVSCVQSFDEVEDEICERDFAVVRGSGRKVVSSDTQALYFDSIFGRPASWASIPDSNISEFCMNSLQRNLELIDPNVPMKTIGRFIGYDIGGTVLQALQNRIGAEQ